MKLTIFTPTYNRLSELPGLYKSIVCALKHITTEDSIEWLIVDDGSKMDISDCIKKFQENAEFEIILIRKENGGKHTAFNVAIDKARSDIFVCIDDDDRLTENALKDIFVIARQFEGREYGGFVGRVVDPQGHLLGNTIFSDYIISNTIEIRDKYHFWGEPEVFFTKILKQYKFDIFDNERFLTEAYLFDKMSLEYPFVYTNYPLMIKVYLTDGLTDNQLKIRIKSPIGCEAYYYQRKLLSKDIKSKLKASINRRRFARYSSKCPRRKIDAYDIIAIPAAFLMSIKDKKDYPDWNKR